MISLLAAVAATADNPLAIDMRQPADRVFVIVVTLIVGVMIGLLIAGILFNSVRNVTPRR